MVMVGVEILKKGIDMEEGKTTLCFRTKKMKVVFFSFYYGKRNYVHFAKIMVREVYS